jgi:hypothetical protein
VLPAGVPDQLDLGGRLAPHDDVDELLDPAHQRVDVLQELELFEALRERRHQKRSFTEL